MFGTASVILKHVLIGRKSLNRSVVQPSLLINRMPFMGLARTIYGCTYTRIHDIHCRDFIKYMVMYGVYSPGQPSSIALSFGEAFDRALTSAETCC